MGHICVVMRATHDMRPAGHMFDMPDLWYIITVHSKAVICVSNENSIFLSKRLSCLCPKQDNIFTQT
jgi:hypothetical protein